MRLVARCALMIWLLHSASAVLFAETWYRSVPDSSGVTKGEYCSIALDSRDSPHMAYFDADYSDLRYARQDGRGWTAEIVDSTSIVGLFTSIAIDAEDRPHIFYQKGRALVSVNHVGMKYATRADTGWVIEFVDSTRAGMPNSYAQGGLNHAGVPCVAYASVWTEQIKFAWKSGDSWRYSPIESQQATTFIKLLFTSQGMPLVGYYQSSSGRIVLAEMQHPDSTWNKVKLPATPFFIPPYDWVDMVIDSEDRVHVVYVGMDFQTHSALYDGSGWEFSPVHDFYSYTTSLAIDSRDNPVLLLGLNDLIQYELVSGEWQETAVVDSSVSIDYFSDALFDSQDHLRIVLSGKPQSAQVDNALIYYRYYPGNPQLVLPEPAHNFGGVAVGSYADWDCPVQNSGDAPLIISRISTSSGDFHPDNSQLPLDVFPGEERTFGVRFTPPSEGSFSDDLTVYSNDPDAGQTTITVQGEGGSAGNTGTLALTAWNIYMDTDNGILKQDVPLDGASISLYQNGTRKYGPIQTNHQGEITLDGIIPGTYDVHCSAEIELPGEIRKPLRNTASQSIQTGINSLEMALPESLMVQKYDLMYKLNHLDTQAFSKWYTFSYSRSEASMAELLNDWHDDLPADISPNLARMILTESMVLDLFKSGFGVGKEAVNDMSDLIGFLYYSDSWSQQLATIIGLLLKAMKPGGSRDMMMQILEMILQEAIKISVLQMATDGVQQAAALVPQPGEDVIVAAWKDVRKEYCGWPNFSFSGGNWEHLKGLVFDMLKTGFFQIVYIDQLTGPSITKGAGYSRDFQFDGSLVEAHEKKTGFVGKKKGEVETVQEIAAGLRQSANLFMMMQSMFGWIQALDPTGLAGEIARNVQRYMKAQAYANITTALTMATYEFFKTPFDMKKCVDRIYFPDGKPGLAPGWEVLPAAHWSGYPDPQPKALLSNKQRTATLEMISNNTHEYDSLLQSIESDIESGYNLRAVSRLNELIPAGKRLRENMQLTASPIYATASVARDSIPGFLEMYDSLVFRYSRAAESRIHTELSIYMLGLDSTAGVQNDVLEKISRTRERTEQLTDQVATVFDTVAANMPMPAIISVSKTVQSTRELLPGSSAQIRYRLTNSGAVRAEDVSVILSTSTGLEIEGPDSIHVGPLDPGEESSEYTWTVRALEVGEKRATWTITPVSSSAKIYAGSGLFSLVKILKVSETESGLTTGLQCYPNPFSPSGQTLNIRYSLTEPVSFRVKVYDIRGGLVFSRMINQSQPGTYETVWNGEITGGLVVANGLYFVVLEIPDRPRIIRKIMVLR